MIQVNKLLVSVRAERDDAAQVEGMLMELDESVLDQIGGGDGPELRNRAWTF